MRASTMPVLIKVVLSLLLLFFVPAQIMAHEGRPVYIQVNEQEKGGVQVRWKIPPVMASSEVPIISLQGGCQRLKSNDYLNDKNNSLNPLSGHHQYQCLKDNSTMRIVLNYPDNNPVLSSLIKFQKYDGVSFSLFNVPDTLTIVLPEKMSLIRVAQQYIQGGFLHILSGLDHLLFVLCLILITSGKRKLILTITGFTLGHSITLSLASLGFVNVHMNVVEVLIALSIVMLIVEITKAVLGNPSQSLIWRYPVIVSLGFGLLHGFGFAGALADLGLPVSMKISALAFFNIGVELGQLAFIAVVLGLIRLISYASISEGRIPLSMIFLYAIGSLSGYWFIDRSLNMFV
jgi:hydrogenase/urease accessory protein HupE